MLELIKHFDSVLYVCRGGAVNIYSPGFNCVSYEIVMNNDTVIERGKKIRDKTNY